MNATCPRFMHDPPVALGDQLVERRLERRRRLHVDAVIGGFDDGHVVLLANVEHETSSASGAIGGRRRVAARAAGS